MKESQYMLRKRIQTQNPFTSIHLHKQDFIFFRGKKFLSVNRNHLPYVGRNNFYCFKLTLQDL